LCDAVGLDICLHTCETLASHLGGEVPETLRKKVQNKELGRKSGKGFYTYRKGKKVKTKVPNDVDYTEIANRLILRYMNESAAVLREGVVEDADLLDAGMIFGTGFAPFRGGPMNYAVTLGINHIQETLSDLEEVQGDRFHADMMWEEKIQGNFVKGNSHSEEDDKPFSVYSHHHYSHKQLKTKHATVSTRVQ